MSAEVDPDFKFDMRRPDYRKPGTAVSALAQMPLYLIDGLSLSNAIMKDWRASKRSPSQELPS